MNKKNISLDRGGLWWISVVARHVFEYWNTVSIDAPDAACKIPNND